MAKKPEKAPSSAGSEPEYEVGNKKPPKHTQFGQPGANKRNVGGKTGPLVGPAIKRLLKMEDPEGYEPKNGAERIALEFYKRTLSGDGKGGQVSNILDKLLKVDGSYDKKEETGVTPTININLGESPKNPPPVPGLEEGDEDDETGSDQYASG